MGGDSVTGGYIMMGGDRVAGGYIMIGSYTVTCGFILSRMQNRASLPICFGVQVEICAKL